MARSQSPRPLRVAIRTLLATPMVIALLAAGGVTAVLAYFALPDSTLDGKRTLFEGTEFAAPTTVALIDGPTATATIRPTLEPLILEEEDPATTPDLIRRTPATRTPTPAGKEADEGDKQDTLEPTAKSTPRTGTVAFLPRTEPTAVTAVPISTRQVLPAPEPAPALAPALPTPNAGPARPATATPRPTVAPDPTSTPIPKPPATATPRPAPAPPTPRLVPPTAPPPPPATATPIPTRTPIPTATPRPPDPTPTTSPPTPTPVVVATPTTAPTSTLTATATPHPTRTPRATATSEASATATPGQEPTATVTPAPSESDLPDGAPGSDDSETTD